MPMMCKYLGVGSDVHIYINMSQNLSPKLTSRDLNEYIIKCDAYMRINVLYYRI